MKRLDVRVDGVTLIDQERQRQLEGWSAAHDDTHERGELLAAAVHFLDAGCLYDLGLGLPPWPFEPEALNLSPDRIRNLQKAGAFIAAEIDRLQRKTPSGTSAPLPQ